MKTQLSNDDLKVAYWGGTRRLRAPEDTLALIRPRFAQIGITRLADVTQLDRLGIHTYCAIRPTSSVLQVSNGKGTSRAAAMTSAAMESIELFHAEHSDRSNLVLASEVELDGPVVAHRILNSFDEGVHYTEKRRLAWARAKNVLTDEPVWVPASNIYFDLEPSVHRPSTNGLASGNHVIEAALHGLYEVLERDAGYLLSQGGKINLRERARIVDTSTIADEGLVALLSRIEPDSQLVMCHLDSRVNVHTFWVVILNKAGGHPLTMLNPGWGTHRDMVTAASRAITEAAQSRLTNIHGAREDIMARSGYSAVDVEKSPAYRFFSSLTPTAAWQELPDYGGGSSNLADDWNDLLAELDAAGHTVLVHDMSRADLDIPVVKVIVPGLGFNQRMF